MRSPLANAFVRAENARFGALGELVSRRTSCVWTVETLPTLSVAIHLTCVVPSAVMSKLVPVVAVPLVAGSLPSVVYVMLATPAPPVSSAVKEILTGEDVYQLELQAPP